MRKLALACILLFAVGCRAVDRRCNCPPCRAMRAGGTLNLPPGWTTPPDWPKEFPVTLPPSGPPPLKRSDV